jgi:menaquinone-dependent protoporphyrinogen oxidase
MAARSVFIVFGSRYGQTAKIARYIGDRLTASGIVSTVASVDALPRDLSLEYLDGVIVGSPVFYSHHLRKVARFVRSHRDALNSVPSAFFSVSGSAGSQDDAERAAARQLVSKFLSETGWHPALAETVGGAMAFTKYNPFLRWVIRRISEKRGGPTDTSRDHEVTDWAQVRTFANAFSALIEQPIARTPGVGTK